MMTQEDLPDAAGPQNDAAPPSPMQTPFWRRIGEHVTQHSLLLPLACVAGCMVILVSPRGDFPLNDDWIYGKTVRSLLTEHRYVRHPFGQPTAISQALWGLLFCWAFGFGFTILRVSTLVLAGIGVWLAALCAKACGLSRRQALLCGLLVVCNPLFVNLSYTFMNDVPFFTAMALSVLFYLRALRDRRSKDVFLGSLFGLVAFFVRQFAIAAALAYLIAEAFSMWRSKTRPRFRTIALFTGPWIVCGLLYLLWQLKFGAPNDMRLNLSDASCTSKAFQTIGYVVVVMTYMGWFLLPLTVVRACRLAAGQNRWGRIEWAVCGCFALVALYVFYRVHSQPLPGVLGNILYDLGAGPMTLRDKLYVKRLSPPFSIGAWWWPITYLAILSGGILTADLARRCIVEPFRRPPAAPVDTKNSPPPTQAVFLFAWAALIIAASYCPFVAFPYDRYTLPVVLPLAIVCAASCGAKLGRWSTGLATALCGALFLFSVTCVQDYMAWNRARWQAIDSLRQERGIDPTRIDGGYEFNGMYTSDIFMAQQNTRDFRQARGIHAWWVLDDTYAVAMVPRPKYKEIARFPYFSWVGFEQRHILLLERTAPENDG